MKNFGKGLREAGQKNDVEFVFLLSTRLNVLAKLLFKCGSNFAIFVWKLMEEIAILLAFYRKL